MTQSGRHESAQLPQSVFDANGNLKVIFRHGFKIVNFEGEDYVEAVSEQELNQLLAEHGKEKLRGGCAFVNSACRSQGCPGYCYLETLSNYWYCVCADY